MRVMRMRIDRQTDRQTFAHLHVTHANPVEANERIYYYVHKVDH